MSGRRWRLTPTPNPTRANAEGIPYDHLAGVSCPTARHCVAVGEYHSNLTADLQTLVETWNGHRWRRTKSPNRVTPVMRLSNSAPTRSERKAATYRSVASRSAAMARRSA